MHDFTKPFLQHPPRTGAGITRYLRNPRQFRSGFQNEDDFQPDSVFRYFPVIYCNSLFQNTQTGNSSQSPICTLETCPDGFFKADRGGCNNLRYPRHTFHKHFLLVFSYGPTLLSQKYPSRGSEGSLLLDSDHPHGITARNLIIPLSR